MKKIVALLLAVSLCLGFAACAKKDGNGTTGKTDTAKGKVYYLNFKPEQDKQWQDLAKKYADETGVEVTVITAAANTYEQTLKSEMAKENAPTLFQVNGPVGLASWKDYCADMKDTAVYKNLKSDDFALKSGNEVLAVAYVIETYGLIYNKAILAKYCKTSGAAVKDASEINNFATLKKVAEDMQSKKEELGIKGAFTSAGMDGSSDWRFKTHLANLPIYYEYKKDNISSSEAIKGTYLDNYKQVWDMYIKNSTTSPKLLSSKTGDDAASEFALGQACFYQNGTWAYNDIKDNAVKEEDMGMLPIYIGVDGEENQGLCTGSENYWCINKKANEDDRKATAAFLEWVITSDEGRTSLTKEMEFVTPFKTFTDEYTADNPLVKASNEYIAQGKTPVSWNFTTIPSETWKNNVGNALLEYAQGTGSWDNVKKAFVNGWKEEYTKTHTNADNK